MTIVTYPPNDGGALFWGKATPPKAGWFVPLPAKASNVGPELARTPKEGALLAAAKAPKPLKALK